MKDRGSAPTLSEAIRRFAFDGAPAFVRIERPVDPFLWFAEASDLRRFYWQDRDGTSLSGLGVAAESASRDPSAFVAELDDGAFAFGGHAFDPDDVRPRGAEWSSLLPGRWVCPALVLETRGGSSRLMRFGPVLSSESKARASGRAEMRAPSEAQWRSSIAQALDAIGTGALEKVVLARRWARPSAEIDPWRLLPLLASRMPGRGLSFAFEGEDGALFFGTSPERLFRRRGDTVETEAVAGTRVRTGVSALDEASAAELLTATKDLHEHAFVRSGIEKALRPLARDIVVGPLAVEPAGAVQHLTQHITARLRPGVHDGDLMAALHPTPAVGGVPQATSLDVVRAQEPFDRGWYAGPVGVVSSEETEIAVGIRSALWSADALFAYAGAGIVAGSDAALEWQEICAKVAPYLVAPWRSAQPWGAALSSVGEG